MKPTAIFRSIIVQRIEKGETTFGNIIVPDGGKEVGVVAKVISAGPGEISEFTNEYIKTTVKEGDTVLLPQMGPVKFTVDGEEYIGCSEKMVLAILEEKN